MSSSLEKSSVPKWENQEDCKVIISLLDLPEATLDCILELLTPLDLFRMARVCTYLRQRCRSDHLWERQVNQKWGMLLGDVVYKEWQRHTTKINTESLFLLLEQNQSGSCGSCSGVWPFLRFHSYLDSFRDMSTSLFNRCSKMALFICLESGRFWFPAQVYQIVPLYCYDAIVSYDSRTDTFRARSPRAGWRMIEENIKWERLRLSPIETYPEDFYISNCLKDLKPGDHIEIQKRMRKELPYDWWRGIVSHLESCNGDLNHCRCQDSDMLVVEFKQYRRHVTRLRRTVLNRNVYDEEQQITRRCWFGGIRKLDEDDIEKWTTFFNFGTNIHC